MKSSKICSSALITCWLKWRAKDRLVVMAGAMEWILQAQRKAAEKETSEDAKKQTHKRYSDAVLNLSKAFALAASSDEAKTIRDEVGFFKLFVLLLLKVQAQRRKPNKMNWLFSKL